MPLFWRKPSLQELRERVEERRFGNRPIDPQETELLVWIGGDPSIADPLAMTLRQLAAIRPDGPVAFLIDNPSLAPREVLREFSARRELIASQPSDLPALLYGRAIETSQHAWCGFAWAGCDLDADALAALSSAARSSSADVVHGDLPAPAPREVRGAVHRGWLEMGDLIPMHHARVRVAAVKRHGGVAAEPLLQRTFWWELTLRLARQGRTAHAPVPAPLTRWTWPDYPFAGDDATTADLAARFTVRRDHDVAAFAGDLPAAIEEDAERRLSAWASAHKLRHPEIAMPARTTSPPYPLRMTLVVEPLDAAHTELVFYSYFRRLPGKGKVTWRATTYDRCRPDDLAAADLVVLARPRFPEVHALLDACERARVPVLVSIDDNWIAAGREYPRFEHLFTPGKPALEAFLEAIRRADATLVVNKRVGEDISSDVRRIVAMPPNTDFSRVDGVDPNRHPGRILVGYAGNPRWERAAFRAMRMLIETDDRCDALIIAHEVPPELSGLPPSRVKYIPFQADLDLYLRTLATEAPDILIAPLDGTRFSASKVAVKFHDTASARAAGIFSNVAPYTDEIRDGENGLLVENRDDDWLRAMRRLAGDEALRQRIATAARQHVESRYSTDRLLDTFLTMLADVVVEARRRRGW